MELIEDFRALFCVEGYWSLADADVEAKIIAFAAEHGGQILSVCGLPCRPVTFTHDEYEDKLAFWEFFGAAHAAHTMLCRNMGVKDTFKWQTMIHVTRPYNFNPC